MFRPEDPVQLPRRRQDPDLLAEPEPKRDEWAPEPWKRVRVVGETNAEIRHPSTPRPRPVEPERPAPVRPPVAPSAHARPGEAATRQATLLGHVVALVVVGVVALIASVVPALAVRDGWPRALLLVMAVAGVGLVLSLDGGMTPLSRGWVANLALVAALQPLASLAVAVARMPAIDLLAGTAWMAIWLVFLLTVVLVVFVVTMAAWSFDAPEESPLLTLPVSLMLVATVGARGELHQASAAQAIAMAALVAAMAGGLAWASQPAWRPLVPPVIFGLFVLALWLTGRGPTWDDTSGAIAPLLVGWIYIVATAITVATVPLAALARKTERESRTTAW